MPRILITDDEVAVESALVEVLRSEGFEVSSTGGGDRAGEKAIELLPEVNPQLVITNYRMGTVDGIGVLRATKQFNPAIPVILTSAMFTAEIQARALAVAPCDFVSLPFRIDEFLSVVNRALAATVPSLAATEPNTVTST